MKMIPRLALTVYLLVCSCHTTLYSHQNVLAAPKTVAFVDAKPITTLDLDPSMQQRLATLSNQYEQRQAALLWAGVEDAIAQQLIGDAARAQKMSTAQFLQQEVENNIGTPTDADLYRLHQKPQHGLTQHEPEPFAKALPKLQHLWQTEQRQKLLRLLVDNLRQKTSVRYQLPAPNLQRTIIPTALLATTAPSVGAEKAPITMVVFIDFQCPYCAQARRLIKKLQALYPSDLRIIVHPFPIASHPQAYQAAKAAMCAHAQQQFWPYYNLLFDNQQAQSIADLQRYAQELHLQEETFAACLQAPQTDTSIKQQKQAGFDLGVFATPAWFINGMPLTGVVSLPMMQSILDKELQQHAKS